jgi:hypothetical protein
MSGFFRSGEISFLGVSLAFVVIRDGSGGGQGEVILLEQGCWSRGGGFVVPL